MRGSRAWLGGPPRQTLSRLVLAFGLILLVHLLPFPETGQLWRAVLDTGHLPLFGLFALIVLRVLRSDPAGSETRGLRPYLLALAIAAATSALAESLQVLAGRDADVNDLLRSTAGASAALLGAAAFDAGLGLDRSGRRTLRGPLLAAAAGLLVATSIPPLAVAAAYLHRWAAFPQVCDLASRWESRLVATHDSTLAASRLPEALDPAGQQRAVRIRFERATYPGVAILEPYPRWTGYDRLVFDVYSELAAPVALVLRIHDARHDGSYEDRFNRELPIQPGVNRVSIPLAEVRRAPRGRPMDLSRIAGLALFAVEPPEAFRLYVGSLRLERD